MNLVKFKKFKKENKENEDLPYRCQVNLYSPTEKRVLAIVYLDVNKRPQAQLDPMQMMSEIAKEIASKGLSHMTDEEVKKIATNLTRTVEIKKPEVKDYLGF